MVFKLCDAGRNSIAIAIILLLTNILETSATEYVFTAPPEVGREVVEIPTSEEEYPLYECDSEADDALDSHDCICTDCEETEDFSPKKSESNSENEADLE